MTGAEAEQIIQLARSLPLEDKLRLMEQLATDLRSQINVSTSAEEDRGNPMLEMAAAADRLGLSADQDDISERFDEELRKTWGEHLERKWNRDAE